MANTFKKPKSEPKPKQPRKQNAASLFIGRIMDGSFLSGGNTLKNVPFALFVFFIAALYIANTYNAERNIRATDHIGKELKEFESEYISLKSDLMYSSNQSQVAIRVAPLELREAETPPHKIYNNIQKPLKK